MDHNAREEKAMGQRHKKAQDVQEMRCARLILVCSFCQYMSRNAVALNEVN